MKFSHEDGYDLREKTLLEQWSNTDSLIGTPDGLTVLSLETAKLVPPHRSLLFAVPSCLHGYQDSQCYESVSQTGSPYPVYPGNSLLVSISPLSVSSKYLGPVTVFHCFCDTHCFLFSHI